MKYKKIVCLMAPLVMLGLLMTGCKNVVTVTSIQKTASYATEDTYTVYYSDGSTSSFTVKNGKDVTVEELYEKYKEIYGDELSYREFLEKYLTVADTSSYVVGEALGASFTVTASKSVIVQSGSAVLYATNEATNSAYIVTNYHVAYVASNYVLEGTTGGIATKISCTLYGSSSPVSCTYVGGSASTDIAVLRTNLSALKEQNENIKPVKIAAGYSVGETVYAVGNTHGQGISATKGIISVDSEEITLSVDGKNRTHRTMRIDAAIYHGNSGGGLFNANCELVGITNGGDEDAQNVNYAVPLSIVTGVADNIIHRYEAEQPTNEYLAAYKPLLGVTVTTSGSKYVYDERTGKGRIEENVVVSAISAISSSSTSNIAYTMGVRVSDVIKAIVIDGTEYPVYRSFEIGDYLYKAHTGSTLKIVCERSGSTWTSNEYTLKDSDMWEVE